MISSQRPWIPDQEAGRYLYYGVREIFSYVIESSHSKKFCRKLREKIRSNTAYFILGCGFKGALLHLGARLYSPGRASVEQTYTGQQMLSHTQEQNQRTNRMYAAIIKHRLTFWRKKIPSSFPFLVCSAPSVAGNFKLRNWKVISICMSQTTEFPFAVHAS